MCLHLPRPRLTHDIHPLTISAAGRLLQKYDRRGYQGTLCGRRGGVCMSVLMWVVQPPDGMQDKLVFDYRDGDTVKGLLLSGFCL